MRKTVTRFFKYTLVGVSTFAFDLALLYILTDALKIQYVVAASIAYLSAISINYSISRKYVFSRTLRSVDRGYYGFLLIAGAGVAVVVILMPVFVEVFELSPFIARTLIAGIVGVWNYLMNLYVNFKVAGKH